MEGVSRRRRTGTTHREPGSRRAPDLVDRNFTAHRPDQLWVADITYIGTWAGFLYLAVVLDAFSRRVVGWAMATHLRTELVIDALNMAIWRRRPEGVIHHSDQGSQYTSIELGKRCRKAGVSLSMGSRGDCYDNALCESFFATLECELLERSSFRTPIEARMAVSDFLEGFYNPHRRHSSLENHSPASYERRYHQASAVVGTVGAAPGRMQRQRYLTSARPRADFGCTKMADLLCISDNDQDKLVIVDLSTMTIQKTVSVGSKPYPVDAIRQDMVMVSTRGLTSVQPVEVSTGNKLPPVSLGHTPRSTTRHPRKALALVAGGDRTLTTVLDTNNLKPLRSVGAGSQDTRRDFGGGLACGHPAWGPNDTILHLDRIARRVELYDMGGELMDSVNLPSSAHHVTPIDEGYLALCEGNPESRINPSVLKFRITDSRITVDAHSYLPVPPIHVTGTGGHHLTYDCGRGVAYVGTNEGRLFTLRASDLHLLNIVDAGPGCGHVTISGQNGQLAVTTNHVGVSMTVIDLNFGRAVGSIDVSTAVQPPKKTQGHTSKWFASTNRLVTTAAQDGYVLEIDPATRQITRKVHVPGAYLIQGCFIVAPRPERSPVQR